MGTPSAAATATVPHPRVSEDNGGTADRVDDSAQILGLPLGCVRAVSPLSPTATIVGHALQASPANGRLGRRERAPDEDHRSSRSKRR